MQTSSSESKATLLTQTAMIQMALHDVLQYALSTARLNWSPEAEFCEWLIDLVDISTPSRNVSTCTGVCLQKLPQAIKNFEACYLSRVPSTFN